MNKVELFHFSSITTAVLAEEAGATTCRLVCHFFSYVGNKVIYIITQ